MNSELLDARGRECTFVEMIGDEDALRALLLIEDAPLWGVFAPVGSELIYELAPRTQFSTLARVEHCRVDRHVRRGDVPTLGRADAILLIVDGYPSSLETVTTIQASHPGVPIAALQLDALNSTAFKLPIWSEQVVVDGRVQRNGNRGFVDKRVVDALERLLHHLGASCAKQAGTSLEARREASPTRRPRS